MGDLRIMKRRRDRCKGKRGYHHPGSARQALRSILAAGRAAGRLRVYKCPDCGLYHVGHEDAEAGRVARMRRLVDAIEDANRAEPKAFSPVTPESRDAAGGVSTPRRAQ